MTDVSIIYICQSSTCRRKGSDATLVEIEELANLLNDENCNVQQTGCLGYCRSGPAVRTISKQRNSKKSKVKIHTRVNTIEKSSSVLQHATGITRLPYDLQNLPVGMGPRLSSIRETKLREYFIKTYQWNKALGNLLMAVQKQQNNYTKQSLMMKEMKTILCKAGYPNVSPKDLILNPRLSQTSNRIENYVSWTLQSIQIVSVHSAIFEFDCSDLKRGTPHPRGLGKSAKPITWHVTMLGEVYDEEENGPLPWIERDYTPISTALEWERGKCRILIKIYNDGKLTSWLHRATTTNQIQEQQDSLLLTFQENESKEDHHHHHKPKIYLSKPIPTLSVPSLASDDSDFQPKSVLLLLAGTGIVAAPQILAHREPTRMLGISTPRRCQLCCPIDLIHSCRDDDMLLLPQIQQYCVSGSKPHPKLFRGLRNYTLLLSSGNNDNSKTQPPFQEQYYKEHQNVNKNNEKDNNNSGDSNKNNVLHDFPDNATLYHNRRLDGEIIGTALAQLVQPYRIVISGPDAYNTAARGILCDNYDVDPQQITVLSA